LRRRGRSDSIPVDVGEGDCRPARRAWYHLPVWWSFTRTEMRRGTTDLGFADTIYALYAPTLKDLYMKSNPMLEMILLSTSDESAL
jgi:hypothetical protein